MQTSIKNASTVNNSSPNTTPAERSSAGTATNAVSELSKFCNNFTGRLPTKINRLYNNCKKGEKCFGVNEKSSTFVVQNSTDFFVLSQKNYLNKNKASFPNYTEKMLSFATEGSPFVFENVNILKKFS